MRNLVAKTMLCQQYSFDEKDVRIEFLMSIGNEYTFKATHYGNDDNIREFELTIKIEEK